MVQRSVNYFLAGESASWCREFSALTIAGGGARGRFGIPPYSSRRESGGYAISRRLHHLGGINEILAERCVDWPGCGFGLDRRALCRPCGEQDPEDQPSISRRDRR